VATSRRDFLRCAAIGTAGLVAGSRLVWPGRGLAHPSPAMGDGPRRAARNSTVIRTYHPDATTGLQVVHQEPVDLMVHAAVRELTGIGDTAAAWKSLFPGITPQKRVSIKINLACGDVPTHAQVVNAIIDGLLMMDLEGQQLPQENIIVWDRITSRLCAQTGYTPNWGGPGVQYVGTDHAGVGFDFTHSFTIEHPHGSISTHHPSRLLTDFSDYIINASVIKDHSDSGVTLSLKNHYGSFDNIGIYQMHTHSYYGDGHTRGEPELNRLLRDELGDKTKLWIIDGTLGLYVGGPGYVPPYHTPPNWAYNSMLVSFDTVALDRIGTEKINEERVDPSSHPPVSPVDPSHVTASAQPPYSLGTDNLQEIDLIEIDASVSTGIAETEAAPHGVLLLSPYPNPTRHSSTLRFDCAGDVNARLEIVDVQGRRVRTMAAGRFGAGRHTIVWDGRDERGRLVPSGVFFSRLDAAGRTQERRVTLIR
jgi:uncharacterized protein (DUF362 family)